MIGRWHVEGLHESVWLVDRGSGHAALDLPHDGEPLDARAASSRIDEWFPEGPTEHGSGRLLVEICADLAETPSPNGAQPAGYLMKEALRHALSDGRLHALRIRVPMGGGRRVDIEPAPPEDDRPAAREQVNPLIDVDPIVVVKKPHTKPKRRPVRLSTDTGFDGTGLFTCSKDAIDFYWSPNGQDKIAFDGVANKLTGARLSGGVLVHAEGVKPSAAMDDIEIKLALSGGSKDIGPEAKEKVTAVEVTLQICASRPAGGGEPAPLSEGDKIDKGRYLLPQKADAHLLDGKLDDAHERAMLIVGKAKPAAFTGELVLKCRGGAVRAFDGEKPAAGEVARVLPGAMPNADIPADGTKLWAEGVSASKDLRDTGFTLGIKDVEDDGDRVHATVLLVTLEVCHSRTAPAGDPAAFTAAAKIADGRYVHKQDAGKNHGRAMLIVKKVVPEAYEGTLSLAPLDAKLAAWDAEDPTAGAALASPYEIANADIPAGGKKVFAEGAAVSGALRDGGFRLSPKDDLPRDGDRINMTVVEMTEIKATIASTPPNTARAGFVLPVDHEFSTTTASPDFAVTEPLVMMRNGQPDIALKVTCAPANVPVQWQAVRNADDHATLGGEAAVPTVTRDAVDFTKATLNANEKGSFRVRPFVAQSATGRYAKHDKEPSIPMNLVLADATVVADNSTANPGVLTATIAAGAVSIKNGVWNAGLPGAGMSMDLLADVTGGGADGRLGLDRVFAGLINDLRNVDITASYRDATAVPPTDHSLINMYVSNRAAATGAMGGTSVFQPGDPAPAVHAYPILDTGRRPGGEGGDSATMTASNIFSRVDRPLGQRYRIQCIDSPGRTFPKTHPINPAAVLRRIHYLHQFTGNFCFWTNVTAVSGATGDAADRVYSVARIVPWQVVGDWNVDYAAAPPTLVATTAHDANNGGATVAPIGRAQDHGVEVRPPSGITTGIAFDGRN